VVGVEGVVVVVGVVVPSWVVEEQQTHNRMDYMRVHMKEHSHHT